MFSVSTKMPYQKVRENSLKSEVTQKNQGNEGRNKVATLKVDQAKKQPFLSFVSEIVRCL